MPQLMLTDSYQLIAFEIATPRTEDACLTDEAGTLSVLEST